MKSVIGVILGLSGIAPIFLWVQWLFPIKSAEIGILPECDRPRSPGYHSRGGDRTVSFPALLILGMIHQLCDRYNLG